MYSNLLWLDHAVTPDRTFRKTDNQDGTITLTPAGRVIQQGTNMSAANFNNMEMGISDVDLAAHLLVMLTRDILRKTETLISETTVEEKTVILKNTAKYPFNSSEQSVSLQKNRITKNYIVDVEIVSANGNIGEIVITDKTLNGFKVAYTGSATEAKFNLKIIGGIIV